MIEVFENVFKFIFKFLMIVFGFVILGLKVNFFLYVFWFIEVERILGLFVIEDLMSCIYDEVEIVGIYNMLKICFEEKYKYLM